MGDLKLTYQVDGGDLVQAGEASSQMKMTLKKLGLPPEIIRKASVCMYEGEINMVIHADGGRVEVEVGMDAITIRLIDQGTKELNIVLGVDDGDYEQAMQAIFDSFFPKN